MCDGTHHALALAVRRQHQVVTRLLKNPQIGLILQHAANRGFVQNAISLRPRGAHCWAFARIQNAELDACFVRGQCHGAAQGIDLLHQMAFANAADRGVAAHLAEGFNIVRQQQGANAHACGSQGCFGAGVAAADHDQVKLFGVLHKSEAL